MDGERHRELLRRWRENEAELRRLLELPVGALDPVARERLLLEEQEQIRAELDADLVRVRRSPRR